jgi:ppGpp synthetase/RelA/SpoT-type nucleotidyltranferase
MNACESDNNALLKEYNEKRALYSRLIEEVSYILMSGIRKESIRIKSLESRLKNSESVLTKISRMDLNSRQLENITDLAGIRLICLSPEDLLKIDKIVKDHFCVISQNFRKINIENEMSANNSRHYAIQLGSSYSGPRYDSIKTLNCEIQVRTVFADALFSIQEITDDKKDSDFLKDFLQEAQLIKPIRSEVTESDKFRNALNSYGALISRCANEPMFQQFFFQNLLFLDPRAIDIYSKPDLGGELIPDFMLVLDDSSYLFVEIEKPCVPLFTKKGNPSSVFTHAQQQIRDYLNWVSNNKSFLRERPKCPNLTNDNFKGLLVIGRTSELSSKEILRFENMNAEVRGKYEIKTFDKIFRENDTIFRNVQAYAK